MSKAEIMFKELGYTDDTENWDRGWLAYKNKQGWVVFVPENKSVRVTLTDWDFTELPHELFVAINEKLKELGWLDECRASQELIDKEVSVKPKRDKRYCGNCDIVRFSPSDNYCSNCGQKIDWRL